MSLTETDKRDLHRVARNSIQHGLARSGSRCSDGYSRQIALASYSTALQKQGASFVTLKRHGELRGCIGTLEAYQPLVQDVADNACSAAFNDPRFLPLSAEEWDNLELNISVLSSAERLEFNSEQDLLRQIRSGVDGLIIEDKGRRGTFLPSVWESLPNPHDFLHHLKQKAGLPPDYWSDTLTIKRYTCEYF